MEWWAVLMYKQTKIKVKHGYLTEINNRVSFWPTVYMYELKKFQPLSPRQPESRQGLSGKGD